MNLLSNLLQFSNNHVSSLMFCESPKQLNLEKNTKQLRSLMSERKEETTPQRRVASKSLSKLDLLSLNSNIKINPRERLLHRMVHKLSMKCRKHYINFFVVLENLKKINKTLKYTCSEEKRQSIQSGTAKIMQIEQILFSKYFQNSLKKLAFHSICLWSRHKLAITNLSKAVQNKYVEESFKALNQYAKRKEKQEIRMDILVDSIYHIERSVQQFYRIRSMENFIISLKNYSKSLPKQPSQGTQTVTIEQYKTPVKVYKVQGQAATMGPKIPTPNSFSKEKANLNLLNSTHHMNYQLLKSKKRISEESPSKPKNPIVLSCAEVKLKIDKCFNFMRNSKNKTNVDQKTLPATFGSQKGYQISKRCEPMKLISQQIPDLNDRGAIFFHQIFSNLSLNSNFEIAESSVKSYCKDTISETFSQGVHTSSQVTLIAPLSHNYNEESRKLISCSGVKSSAFGSEAVNFKNSLVIEREMLKNQCIDDRIKEKKEFNFAKVKNQVRHQKKAHDDYQNEKKAHEEYLRDSESRFRMENRYDTAEKDYTSLKEKEREEFSIVIPQGVASQSTSTSSRPIFSKRSCETPEPEPIRNFGSSERKHLSLVNNNKANTQQEDSKKGVAATYLKILSKR